MSAEDREQKHEAGTAGSASAVSMRELLASCAAADAVSKPPSGSADGSGSTEHEGAAQRRTERDAA